MNKKILLLLQLITRTKLHILPIKVKLWGGFFIVFMGKLLSIYSFYPNIMMTDVNLYIHLQCLKDETIQNFYL